MLTNRNRSLRGMLDGRGVRDNSPRAINSKSVRNYEGDANYPDAGGKIGALKPSNKKPPHGKDKPNEEEDSRKKQEKVRKATAKKETKLFDVFYRLSRSSH